MIHYLIIDDEPIAHDIIKGYCDLLPSLQLSGQCYDALEAIEYLRHTSVDLIFLDLNMPKLKGFDFLKTLASPPQVIVTTAYSEYALEGYQLNVVDYLLKPFGFDRFLQAVNKVTLHRSQQPNTSSSPTYPSVFLKSDKQYIQVFLDQVTYIEAAGNYTKVNTQDQSILVRDTFSEVMQLLEGSALIQVHKSYAIAPVHVNKVEGNKIWIEASEIPVGKTYRQNLRQIIGS